MLPLDALMVNGVMSVDTTARVCLAAFWERSEEPASNDPAQNLNF
ncbi:MAG: hypothetical protein ACI9BK_001423 [Acidimicrobiales bacterium]|jgi:hypothetical protein